MTYHAHTLKLTGKEMKYHTYTLKVTERQRKGKGHLHSSCTVSDAGQRGLVTRVSPFGSFLRASAGASKPASPGFE